MYMMIWHSFSLVLGGPLGEKEAEALLGGDALPGELIVGGKARGVGGLRWLARHVGFLRGKRQRMQVRVLSRGTLAGGDRFTSLLTFSVYTLCPFSFT